MLPAVDCTSATSEHSADFRVIITQVKTQKQNLPPLFRQTEQSDCQRFIFHNHLFPLNNKHGRHLLNDKVFICAERLKVYFFEILKRYFVLLLSLYFAIRVERSMIKHRLAKTIECMLDMFPVLFHILQFNHPLFFPDRGAKQITPIRDKIVWTLSIGNIKSNYMICVFILMGAKLHISY